MSTENCYSRRSLLRSTAVGFGAFSLNALSAETDTLAARMPHFAAKAKRVIFLFMHGGPSHIDTFDPKPLLQREHGKPLPFKLNLKFAKDAYVGGLMGSPFTFKQYGQSGMPVSNLFPNLANHVDDMCFIRSMIGDGVDHGSALQQIHTGSFTFARPSMGSWVLYGLGTENQSLPGFVTIRPNFSQRAWASGFLPGYTQGTPIGTGTSPAEELIKTPIENLTPKGITTDQQRYELEMVRHMNRRHQEDRQFQPQLEGRIQSLELAARMQLEAPEAFDTNAESAATRKLYGLDDPVTKDFGWQCLLARRLAERGVRFIQCSHSYKWDQHTELARLHTRNAREVDLPIAGLLSDLKERGLLQDTLVLWGGEFGRTPYAERDGRDHNPYGYTMWLAGGGVKGGTTYGSTDDYGYHAVENRTHIHDLHATMLHLLGLDHERLTYPYAGRNFRLTDVHGIVAKGIIA